MKRVAGFLFELLLETKCWWERYSGRLQYESNSTNVIVRLGVLLQSVAKCNCPFRLLSPKIPARSQVGLLSPQHVFAYPSQGKMIMGRFVCFAGFMVFGLLIFSSSILADRVDSLPDRADSVSDNSIHFTHANFASVDDHSAFFESRTSDFNEGHVNWLGDLDDHHGQGWGWQRHHDGDSGGKFGDPDSGDTDADGGKTGTTGSGGASTLAVPEPSVLVLLSAALAAFLLKSLRRAIA